MGRPIVAAAVAFLAVCGVVYVSQRQHQPEGATNSVEIEEVATSGAELREEATLGERARQKVASSDTDDSPMHILFILADDQVLHQVRPPPPPNSNTVNRHLTRIQAKFNPPDTSRKCQSKHAPLLIPNRDSMMWATHRMT